jgi:predicted nucleic-acid-binding protein
MISVDTNVLVRLYSPDDSDQERAARALLENESIWIAKTVILETAWVLTSLYGFTQEAVRDAFVKLFGLANVQVENESEVAIALALVSAGVDLADAMHLASRPPGSTFVTFDKSFVRRARRAGAPLGWHLGDGALIVKRYSDPCLILRHRFCDFTSANLVSSRR